MLAERPDLDEYYSLSDDIVDYKYKLNKAERILSKLGALSIKEALLRGAKTREVDIIKIVGNNLEQENELDKLHNEIIELKRSVDSVQGKIYAWLSKKDLYIADSYHQVRGTFRGAE